MIKVYLIRHGETEWNKIGKMQGGGNSPLSELGKNQAEWLKDKIKDLDIDLIYSSPTGRTMETAEIIKGEKNIEIIKHDGIREINVGKWEGLDKEVVKELYTDEHYNFWNAPHKYHPTEGGESFYEVRERVYRAVMDLVNNKDNEDKTILIVSHAITIKSLICKLENKEVEDFWYEPIVQQTSLTEINFDNGSYEIIQKGDVSHYQYCEN